MKAIDVLRGLLKDTIEPMLLADGFRRLPRGDSHVWVMADYNRPGDGMVHSADLLRLGRHWQVDRGEFRLGFGVLVPSFDEVAGRRSEAETVSWCDPQIRTNTSVLKLTAKTDVAAMRQQIRREFDDDIRPWFAERETPTHVRDCLERDRLFSASVVANIALGDSARARGQLRLAVKHRNEHIIPIAFKHGTISEAEHKKLQWAVIQDVDTLNRTVAEVLGPST